MVHTGILPHHPRWAEFFRNLRYVVIDEIHVYRGVFGSHIANLIRRLKRVAAFYGAYPQFFLTSATIANPGQLAERLIELPVAVVDEDGSPRRQAPLPALQPAGDRTRARAARQFGQRKHPPGQRSAGHGCANAAVLPRPPHGRNHAHVSYSKRAPIHLAHAFLSLRLPSQRAPRDRAQPAPGQARAVVATNASNWASISAAWMR
jgi:hypothetical protein